MHHGKYKSGTYKAKMEKNNIFWQEVLNLIQCRYVSFLYSYNMNYI